MPFKLKVIKEFQKSTKTQGGNQNQQVRSSPICQPETQIKDRSISRKRIVKKSLNMYQNDLKLYPIENRHIANFFNIIGINEDAIRNNQCGQSYFRTLFYLKNIKKIEVRPTCLILQLVDSPMQFPPLAYVVERFESFGDQRFHHLAQLMKLVANKINELNGINTKPQREQGHDFMEKYIQSLGNRMYVCRISNNKMLLSRSLLQQLELNPEEFALEALRFRTPMYEAASTEKYYDVIVKYMENMINLLDLVRDKISLETFLDNSVMRFKDYFFTKKNKRLYCKMKTGMPHPLVTIFELEEVISRAEQFENSMYYGAKRLPELANTRQRIRKTEVNSVKAIMNLPANYLPQNDNRVTGYLQITD